ncbi:MAG: hypothetical protein FJ392_14215 [Verrucomicrobia bacterium]|nr:hypothetical protein [Verrucomicrobiota bacterium]
MQDPNKRNLLYFESLSMRGLFDELSSWQTKNEKRLLSVSIQQDGDRFCCIALSNPTEVIICSGSTDSQAQVKNGCLDVWTQ